MRLLEPWALDFSLAVRIPHHLLAKNFEKFLLTSLFENYPLLSILSLHRKKQFRLNTRKYGPEITPYLDTFHVMKTIKEYQTTTE